MAEEHRIRTKEIRVKVTEYELKVAKDKAEYLGINMGTMFRQLIMNDNVKKIPVEEIKEVSKAINEYKFEINKVGNNINQIVKVIHENNDLYEEEEIKELIYLIETVSITFNDLTKEIYERLYNIK